MIYATDFTYNGISLSSISPDLVIASLSDESSYDGTIISRTANRSAITYDEPFTHDYGVVDNDVFKFKITVIHTGEDGVKQPLAKRIIDWTMSPTTPRWMQITRYGCIDTEQVYDDVCYIGRFVSASYETLGGEGRKIGMSLMFECSSPYAYTPEFTFETVNGAVNIRNYGTHVGKVITPTIILHPSVAGDLTVQNTADTSQGALSIHADGTSPIKIENFNTYIYNDVSDAWDLLPFNNHVLNYNWPVIIDGDNHFVVTGGTAEVITRFYAAYGV